MGWLERGWSPGECWLIANDQHGQGDDASMCADKLLMTGGSRRPEEDRNLTVSPCHPYMLKRREKFCLMTIKYRL